MLQYFTKSSLGNRDTMLGVLVIKELTSAQLFCVVITFHGAPQRFAFVRKNYVCSICIPVSMFEKSSRKYYLRQISQLFESKHLNIWIDFSEIRNETNAGVIFDISKTYIDDNCCIRFTLWNMKKYMLDNPWTFYKSIIQSSILKKYCS